MNLRKLFFTVLAAGLVWSGASYAATSWLVSSSPTGLVYGTYANQNQSSAVNKIPDFSKAGYQGGGVTIPFVPAAVTVSPSGGDDTAAIQNAINTVSAMPVGADGFRGAVVLEAGDYTVSSSLSISTSGVVLRGAGSQESGGTKITYTAKTSSNVINISGGSGPSEIGGTRVDIADSFVPVGAKSFTVSDASGFSPGDQIMVQNMVNDQWITDLSDMSQWGWSASGYQIGYRYVVTAVNGNTITIDAPIVQTIEDQYGGGDVYRYSDNLLENIGVEAIRFVSTYEHIIDEDHGVRAVRIDKLQNGWVRQITARHFVQGAVSIDSNSQFITVEDCAALDHISLISGGRRYSFSIDDSQYLLIQRCLTRDGRHDYVSGSRTPGPNAFVDCRADEPNSDTGPHHRYATGQIYDNIMGGAIN
ncbi:MAG TPA: hypothetical protein VJ904_06190, partial [Tichowtungia sp.]|nr:hypothetical protein [Tichowtungia sp.]